MKQLKQLDRLALSGGDGDASSLAESKNRRRLQKECNQRIEELKMRIFRITERHMEQAIRLARRWLADNDN
jgi:hypothetical protein